MSDNDDRLEDIYTMPNGLVIFQWPPRILQEEAQDLDSWMDMMKRKLQRSVQKEEIS